MSFEAAEETKILVQGLAAHVRKAAQSGAGGKTAPGSPPVQSIPRSGAGTAASEKCVCCGFDAPHEGVTEGRIVSEEVWYGFDEEDDLRIERGKIDREIAEFISRLPEETKADLKERNVSPVELIFGPLKKRNERNRDLTLKFEARRDALEFARGNNCEYIPEPPCDVYKVVNEIQVKTLEAAWDFERAQFESDNGMLVGEPVIHRVPFEAGGCPFGERNKVQENKLSPDCLKGLEPLRQAQADAVERWRQGGF